MSTLEVYASVTPDFFNRGEKSYMSVHNDGLCTDLTVDDGAAVLTSAADQPAYPYAELHRNGLSFDTSSIPAGSAIQAATLRLTLVSKALGDAASFGILHIVQGAHSTPAIAADYGDIHSKTTSGGSVAYSAVSGTFTITLNSSGLGWIIAAGTTKLSLRMAGEKDGTTPTPDVSNVIALYSHDGTAAQKPLLTVTYFKASYPKSALGRVGSLVHRRDVDESIYTLEITFGGIRRTAPSSPSMAGAGAGYDELGPSLAEQLAASPPLPEPPRRKVTDYIPMPSQMPFEGQKGLTGYSQMRAQELYEQGFINEKGEPTPKGLQWAKEHPTEEAPRTYTTGMLGSKLYLAQAAADFYRKTGKVPSFPGAEQYVKGELPYSEYERLGWQAEYLTREAKALRTREQIISDIAAGRSQVERFPGDITEQRFYPKGLSLRQRIRMARAAGRKYF